MGVCNVHCMCAVHVHVCVCICIYSILFCSSLAVPTRVTSPRHTSPPTLPHSPSPPPSHHHHSTLTSSTDTPHSSSFSNSFRKSKTPTSSPLHSREGGSPRANRIQTTVSDDHITSLAHFASRTGPRTRAPESEGVKSRHSPSHIPVLSRREGSSSPLDFYSGLKVPAFTTGARHRVLDTRSPNQELSLYSADLTEQKRGDDLTTESRSVLVADQDRYPSRVGTAFEDGHCFSIEHTGNHHFTEDLSPTVTPSSKKTTSGTSRTVKFLSPVHQVVSEDSVTPPPRCQTREEDLAPELKEGIGKVNSRLMTLDPTTTTQLAPSPNPTRELKDSSETMFQYVPNPSLSHSLLGTTGLPRTVGGLQHTSSQNATTSQDEAGSPGKQATGIGHVSSTESLTGSEHSEIHSLSAISLASRRSLPASLGSRSAFSPLRGSLSQQQGVLQLSASLPQLGRTKDSDTNRTHRYLCIHVHVHIHCRWYYCWLLTTVEERKWQHIHVHVVGTLLYNMLALLPEFVTYCTQRLLEGAWE